MININSLEVLPNEIWKLHEESELAVSNLGRCYLPQSGTHSAHYTYGNNISNGYKGVMYKGKHYLVHRLVAQCFIPNLDNLPTVDHINRDKTDNRVENLRWADMSLQMINRSLPLNNARSKQVMQINPNTNEVIRIWSSTMECGRNGFHQGNVSACCNNKFTPNSPNIYKGFKWQYA